LIYVWAIEQDELSKRAVLTEEEAPKEGKDVVVPWVLNKGQSPSADATKKEEVYNRYYHMFAKGELCGLVFAAAKDLGLLVGQKSDHPGQAGLEIVQDGWERSNYYVEIQRWRT
jgi:tRNA (uracil-5-)-methyltransferase TRM9